MFSSKFFLVFFFVLLCILTACSARREDAVTLIENDAVRVVEVSFPSEAISDVLRYRAIVPRAPRGQKFSVLYFLHGANSGPAQVMDMSDVVKLATENHLIVILPDGQFSYYTNARYRWHARWEDAITRDLPKDVVQRFPVETGREHTGIAGLSMGGYGAVKLALKHPQQYAFAATMSGALDITERGASWKRWQQTLRIWRTFGVKQDTRYQEDIFHLMAESGDLRSVGWFASCGTKDSLYGVNQRFVREMQALGLDTRLLESPYGHEWPHGMQRCQICSAQRASD